MKKWLSGLFAFVLFTSCFVVSKPNVTAETDSKETGTNVDPYYYGTGSTICYTNAVWEENLTVKYGHSYGRVVTFENCTSAAIRTLSTVSYELNNLHVGIEDFTGDGLRFMISNSGTSVEIDPGLVFTVKSGEYIKVKGQSFSEQMEFNKTLSGKIDVFTEIKSDGSLAVKVAGTEIVVPADAITGNFTDITNIYVQFFALTEENIGTMSFNFTTIHNGDCEIGKIINNKDLTPKYVPDDQVTVDENGSPDWLSQLVIAEVKLSAATEERTFQGAVKILDLYEEMGVNGIWITPIYDGFNFDYIYGGYANYGPHTVHPALTGTDDYEEGWQVVKNFIDEAHKRNIRVFLDAVSWGVSFESPLLTEHPDWFEGTAWDGAAYNWNNEEFKAWYIDTWVNNILTTGADGLRCDCEPGYSGYTVYSAIRQELVSKGRKIALMSEHTNTRESDGVYAYDIEQFGVNTSINSEYNMGTANNVFFNNINITRACSIGKCIGNLELQNAGKGGTAKYYTFMLSCHDHLQNNAKGNRAYVGYQAILAPFIPLWFMGEEWNDSVHIGVQYGKTLNWDKLYQYENREFFEDYKKYIAIRWSYPEIFGYFPDNHRETNICSVKTSLTSALAVGGAYARYGGGKAVIVSTNKSDTKTAMTITIPYSNLNLEDSDRYRVVDLITGEIIAQGTQETMTTFDTEIQKDYVGAYLIEAAPDAGIELLPESSYEIKGNYVVKIKENTTVAQLISNFKYQETLKVFAADGTEITSGIVGTGCILQSLSDGVIAGDKTLVVYGDYNGDGEVTTADVMLIKRYFLNSASEDNEIFYASDVNRDGRITTTDYMRIKKYISGDLEL